MLFRHNWEIKTWPTIGKTRMMCVCVLMPINLIYITNLIEGFFEAAITDWVG